MRRSNVLRTLAGAALAIGLILPILLLPAPAGATSVSIVAQDNEYEPPSRSIHPNDSVTWHNDGNLTHNVTFDNGPYGSQDMSPGGSTPAITFSSTGTFNYHCRFYPDQMKGKIVVTTGSTNSPTPGPTGTQTITITPTPKPTKKKTHTPSPSPSKSTASPSPSPSVSLSSFSAVPTPSTESPTPSETASAIDTGSSEPTGSSSSGNTQAVLAIVGVLALGILGFLVYRRTLRS